MTAFLTAILFVLIWSTGLVTAKVALAHASLGLFLAVRMMLTAIILAIFATVRREVWPGRMQIGWHVGAGALLNGVYLCLAYLAIALGLPVGIMSLLASTQPLVIVIVTALLFGRYPPWRVACGMAVATGGVLCVLAPILHRQGLSTAVGPTIAVAAGAVLGMAVGTMIQQGYCARDPLLVSSALQNLGGVPVALLAWLLAGEARWDGSLILYGALAWSIVGLSAIAVPLIVWMVRSQGPTRMSMLLLLVPPLAALESWALFHEELMSGFAFALGGVLLTRWR